MRTPVCVACEVEMSCARTGAHCELMAEKEGYQIWSGDIFRCPICGVKVITGWASKPLAEAHHIALYSKFLKGVTQRFWNTVADKNRAAV